jgi:hypothetical protein
MRIYELHARDIVRTDSPDDGDRIRLVVPDVFTADDVDRALDRLRRDVRKVEKQ